MKIDLKRIEQARQEYEALPVPPELESRLQRIIGQHQFSPIPIQQPFKGKYWHVPAVAATCAVILFAVFSFNPAIAQSMEDIPLLSNISRVFTVQTWFQQDESGTLQVTQPALRSDSALAQSINVQIEHIVSQHTAEAEQLLAEYKEAFLATGGTEKEWAEHDLHAKIDYQIMLQNTQYLSFVLTSVEDWSNAYTQVYYYNIDLKTNKIVTLEDLLGENYLQIANESIKQQMKERMAADKDITYFSSDMDGFTTIDENTNFYMNEAGNPVIVFARYEVAPGFMGEQEFEIVRESP